jgi:hypothetical protein
MADIVGGNYWAVRCSEGIAHIFVANRVAEGQVVKYLGLMPICFDRMMPPEERAYHIAKYDGTWGSPIEVLGTAPDYTPPRRKR